MALSLISFQSAADAADVLAPAPPPSPIASSSFQGFYAAAGGAYGVSNNRQFTIANFFVAGNADPAGVNGSIATGVNLVFGSVLLGLELDGRIGGERAQRDVSVDFGSLGSGTFSYRFQNQGGGHIAGRIGGAFNDTLIYLKLGAGVASIEDRFSANETGVSFCGPCTAVATERHWRPTVLLGVGAEQNVGRFFGRLYAETEFISLQSISTAISLGPGNLSAGSASQQDLAWTARAGGLVGLRF